MKQLKFVRLGIDTRQEFVVLMHTDCFICKSEGFGALAQVLVTFKQQSIVATLQFIKSNVLKTNEISLSESALQQLNVEEGDWLSVSHLSPVSSFSYIHDKIQGNELSFDQFNAVLTDIVAGHYSNIHLASFITACAGNHLNGDEIVRLTQAMVNVGEKMRWDYPMVLDKHSIGGIPGNRTTPIVVAIAAAAGIIIPKTSSRAITSPAGTADTLETMTNVTLTAAQVRKVVEKENGCMVWGGALGISPADDILIRVERVLDLDPMGQMVASVLSKKAAMGVNHAIIDMPVGATAKIQTWEEAHRLEAHFTHVGQALGVNTRVIKTNGDQPLGQGIGPALEAKDILAVLQNSPALSLDLKNKAIMLAGHLLALGKGISLAQGESLAAALLTKGDALKKFLAICDAQGGFKEPATAAFHYDINATCAGRVISINNRELAKVAKLAGAPQDPAAGIEFYAKMGTLIEVGQPLYRIHAESKGALHYAMSYVQSQSKLIEIKPDEQSP